AGGGRRRRLSSSGAAGRSGGAYAHAGGGGLGAHPGPSCPWKLQTGCPWKLQTGRRKSCWSRHMAEGALIIIGGREDKTGERLILKEVARWLKGGRLVVCTVASYEPNGYFDAYRKA